MCNWTIKGCFWCLVAMMIFSTGCVSWPTEEEMVMVKPEIFKPKEGVYHTVTKGQTLWRISKTYEIDIKDILSANNIGRGAPIKEGQKIFIPERKTVQEIVLDANGGKKDFTWPIQGKIIKYFQQRNGLRTSKGIDIQAPAGENVLAARTGRVVFADYLPGYGYTIILDHEDGIHSVYSQNAKLLVSLGDLVVKRNPIAQLGQHNSLAYLHFEIRKNALEDNPLYYLP